MSGIPASDSVLFFLQLGVLLGVARIFGELSRAIRFPVVLGEIIAGVVLGPTIFGAISPESYTWLFPETGITKALLDGVGIFALTLFLLVAGLEIDLVSIIRQGRHALRIAILGMIIPFAVGFGAAYFGYDFFGASPDASPLLFAFFFGAALAISALPMISRILLDLGLFHTDIGMVVTASAVFNDLVGWIIFSIILGLLSAESHGLGVGATIGLTLGYAVLMLTVGRWIINRILPFIQAHTSWPGGVLGLLMTLAMLGAAFTEAIGVHAIFGAFIVGVAAGDSHHLRERTKDTIHQFVTNIFAPLFFVQIGLRLNFIENFNLSLIIIVFILACFGKVIGAFIAGTISGFTRNESLAIGFAMNARGTMEIILALVALQSNLIGADLFVAIMVMSFATTLMTGPMVSLFLARETGGEITDLVGAKTFIPKIMAIDKKGAIEELCQRAADILEIDPYHLTSAVLARESIMSTALGKCIAVPHARLDLITKPQIIVGRSPSGIDYDAPDGELVHLLFLLLTPTAEPQYQLKLLSGIAKLLKHDDVRLAVLRAESSTELLAALRTQPHVK